MPDLPLPRRLFTSRNGMVLPCTALGLGTAPLGNLYAPMDETTARQTLDAAWDGGMRLFDTAPFYGLGLAEVRMSGFLRGKPRGEYLLSTKVGRYLTVAPEPDPSAVGKFFDCPTRRVNFDYSYDGVMRSLEHSFERLGVDRLDIVLVHDVDVSTHGTRDASDRRIAEFMAGGYRALDELRAAGTVGAIGGGINDWEVAQALAEQADLDLLLLAGRYTLLEQDALETLLPLCERRGIGILLGGPYNSGILASGPKPGAFYNYEPAPEAILDRVRRIEAICTAHGVRLATAALQFPLGHPTVVSVIPGARSASEVTRNLAQLSEPVPAALWSDLRTAGLLRPDAPLPV